MNSFGHIYRFTTFGESHGAGIGVVIDGCPAGLRLDPAAIQTDLDRRKPGQSKITTQRKEPDAFELLSGHVDHVTTGAPLAFFVRNKDQKSKDYSHIETIFRPSHADYTYFSKYGIRDHRGGGRSSARETLARVIAGGVAKQLLAQGAGMVFEAWVSEVGGLGLQDIPDSLALTTDNARMVRCPDPEVADKMVDAIMEARKAGDSLGGVITGRVRNVPVGLGEPIYQKVEALLGSAMLSINAVKGFEIGSGFAGARMRGSEHNDLFYTDDSGQTRTRTNRSGGVQGGISNGEDLIFRVAFKPTSTLMRDQESVNTAGESVVAKGKGRHDPCVVPRAVPIVEAMAACVLADLWLMDRSSRI